MIKLEAFFLPVGVLFSVLSTTRYVKWITKKNRVGALLKIKGYLTGIK